MRKKKTVKNGYSLLNFLLLVILPLFLLSKKFYMVVSLYTVLMSIQLILVYKKNIKTSLESFSSERKKLKNLEYYYVTDDYKVIDLNKRKTTFRVCETFSVK